VIDVIESEQWVAAARSLRLDPYCSLRPRFLGLPDANAVLSSVDNDCRNARRSRLLRMAEGGTAALYAPTHVYWEIYRRLPRLASFSPVPLVDLRRHFEEEYLPVMRFVRVSAGEVGDPQVLAITDPDDVPMGQLAKLIAPCVVFSMISLCAGQGSPRRTGGWPPALQPILPAALVIARRPAWSLSLPAGRPSS